VEVAALPAVSACDPSIDVDVDIDVDDTDLMA
jgi:hypothetical protein